MGSLIERWESGSDPRQAAELERRLVSGQGSDEVAKALGVTPSKYVEALAWLGLGGSGSEGPGLVQARPTRPVLAKVLDAEALAGLFPGADPSTRLALSAGLLQVHDFWDASHNAAQVAEDCGEREFSAYWHGIAHRREPDAGNASYWFRRVGRHQIFAELCRHASAILASGDPPVWASKVVRDGEWQPLAFIEVCTSRRDDQSARRLQRLEMDLLLAATLSGCES